MALYGYRALNPQGGAFRGYISGENSKNVLEKLYKRNLEPLSIRRVFSLTFGRWELWQREMMRFFLYLEYAVRSGVPLAEGLLNMAVSFSGKFQAIVHSFHEELMQGALLSQVCQNYSTLFSPVVCALVKLGENSGDLGQSCRHIREYLVQQGDYRKKIMRAIRYPAISFAVLIAAGSFFISCLLPELVIFFQMNDLQVPPVTRFLMGLLNISWWGVAIILAAFLFPTLGLYVWLLPKSRLWLGALSYRILPFGQLRAHYQYTRFLHALTILCREQMHLLLALTAAKHVVSSPWLRTHLDQAQESVISGKKLSNALEDVPFFGRFYIQIIRSGESTGNLTGALDCAWEVASKDTEQRFDYWLSMLEPLLLLMITGVIVFLLSSMLLPFYEHLGDMAHGM